MKTSRPRFRVETLEDRLTPAYRPDVAFAQGGVLPVAAINDGASVAVEADGDILVGTTEDNVGVVYRVKPDGSPDPTFGTAGRQVVGRAGADPELAVAADGRVYFVTETVTGNVAVFRLNADGSPDATFGTAGLAVVSSAPGWRASVPSLFPFPVENTDRVDGVTARADGGLLVFARSSGVFANGYSVLRLTADGRLDDEFGTGGVAAVPVERDSPGSQRVYTGGHFMGHAVDADGRIVVAGGGEAGSIWTGNSSHHVLVARLTPDGRPDRTFGDAGVVTAGQGGVPATTSVGLAVGVQSDGRVLLTSSETSDDPNPADANAMFTQRLIRLTAGGAFDPSFGTAGSVSVPAGGYIGYGFLSVRPDDHVLLTTNSFRTSSGELVVLDPAGQWESTTPLDFGGRGLVVYSHAVAADGRVVYGGMTNEYMNTTARVGVLTDDPAAEPPVPPLPPEPEPVVIPGRPYAPSQSPDYLIDWPPGAGPNAPRGGSPEEAVAPTRPAGPPAPTVVVGGTDDGRIRRYQKDATGMLVAAGAESVFAAAVPVRAATADVDGDGTPDQVYGAGPGGGSRVKVALADGSVVEFDAFEAGFTGGVFVAAADLDGDGAAEVVVSPDEGGGGRVTVFAVRGGAAVVRDNFFGIDDLTFRGGARVAVGDVDGNGRPDLIVSAGFGGGPRVAVFDGRQLLGGRAAPGRLVNDFYAFPGADAERLRNGAFVTAADLTADGRADLVFGGGPGGAPRVLALDAARLMADPTAAHANPVANFFAGDEASRGGVRVAAAGGDILAASGGDEPSRVRVYPADTFGQRSGAEPPMAQTLDPFGDAVAAGVFVG